jgi:hypothetical protein
VNIKHTIAASLIGILLIPVASLAENALVPPGALRQSIQREAVRLASDGRPVFLVGAVPGFVIGSSIGAVVAFYPRLRADGPTRRRNGLDRQTFRHVSAPTRPPVACGCCWVFGRIRDHRAHAEGHLSRSDTRFRS